MRRRRERAADRNRQTHPPASSAHSGSASASASEDERSRQHRAAGRRDDRRQLRRRCVMPGTARRRRAHERRLPADDDVQGAGRVGESRGSAGDLRAAAACHPRRRDRRLRQARRRRAMTGASWPGRQLRRRAGGLPWRAARSRRLDRDRDGGRRERVPARRRDPARHGRQGARLRGERVRHGGERPRHHVGLHLASAGTERMRMYLVDAAGATMLIIADSLDGATFADITRRRTRSWPR